jgi:hypothetical protein
MPRRSDLAGELYPVSDYAGSTSWRTALSQRYPNGVRFTLDGYPDFSPYAIRIVEVEGMTGEARDFRLADRAAGFNASNPRPDGFTWHHHQNGTHMLLVPTDLHDAISHSGGASRLRARHGISR